MTKLIPLLLLFSFCSLWGKDYYVAKTGNDSQAGTEASPFLTINKALTLMSSGDVCIIHEGIYRETLNLGINNLTFKAAEGETVEVSGFNKISKWSQYDESIYVCSLSTQLDDRNMLLFDGKIMNLARWPNKTNYNPFDLEAYKAYGGSDYLSYGDIPDQNWADGGVLYFIGKNRWTSWRTHITDYNETTIYFSELSSDWSWGGSHNPSNGGEFFLQNTLEALDSEGEWYIDRNAKKLYFWAPKSMNPEWGEALVKARETAFNLNNRSGISIEGIRITGANVTMSGASNCHLKNCEILFGNHSIASTSSAFSGDASVVLSDASKNNVIDHNNIQWGAGNGIILKGSGNMVRNNYIGNFNYLGSYACPVEMRGANDLMNNEIFNGGRDAVRGGGNGSDCGYNNIHHSNLINDDCGAIYTCCGSFGNTRIHHNWIHDISSRNENFDSYKGAGVYLDNSTKNVIVDHNVFWNLEWTCIQINWEGENLQLYNNTLWSNNASHSAAMGRWVNGYDIINVKFYNNLSNKGPYEVTDNKNTSEVALEADVFEDFNHSNFMPKDGAPQIDAGRTISGFTNNVQGAAPDAGAYEKGGEQWLAGPDWTLSDNSQVDSLAFRKSFSFQWPSNDTYKVPVEYYVQDISKITMTLVSPDNKILSQKIETVYQGSGTVYVDLPLKNMPAQGQGYTLVAELYNNIPNKLFELREAIAVIAPIPPNNILISPPGVMPMVIGEQMQYTVSTEPDNASHGFRWESSDSSVAYVDEFNTVYAVGEGQAMLTLSAYNGLTKSTVVVVSVPLKQRFLSKIGWEVIYADSESTAGFGSENKDKAIDGDESTFWHTVWKKTPDPLPHEIQVDMKESHLIEEFYYLPRQDDYGPNGTVGAYELYVSNSTSDWGDAVASGTFDFPVLESDKSNLAAFKKRQKVVLNTPKEGRYFRFVALSETQNDPNIPYTSAAEFDLIAQSTAGLSEQNNEDVLAFPNPTSKTVFLNNTHLLKSIEVLDLQGRCLLHCSPCSSVDLSPFDNGIYIFCLEQYNGNRKIIKIQKQ